MFALPNKSFNPLPGGDARGFDFPTIWYATWHSFPQTSVKKRTFVSSDCYIYNGVYIFEVQVDILMQYLLFPIPNKPISIFYIFGDV